ncbi:ABC transporter substrate-binding protein [Leucobacter allii]|uniref:ABC transporter substrate-binding protein n=1 Tax=Leucobacter allii TaxID=2932247 RepID=A0ABY4FMH5_9MICO|nr:ABC transporter substrate-binding protein [Leucobacter allii]UOQ57469.1 ABC transporter substrate-binding protein [Leucobacter allii]
MKRSIIRGGAIAAAAALALTACSGGGEGGSSAGAEFTPTDTIRATLDIPATFDPMLGLSLPDFVLARQSFDTLVRKDEGGLVPGLAASWDSTPTSASFTLRDGATCSDGTPITATVVKNSLDALAGSAGSIVPQTFGGQVPTITADDAAGTVSLALETPWPYLVQALSTSSTGIVCPAGLADLEGLAAGHVEGAESGPYIQTAVEPGVRYTYELRDDYEMWPEWTSEVAGEPARTIEFVISPDTSATTNLVLDGQLDIAKIMPESMDRFTDQAAYEVTPFLFSDFSLVFNEREGSPFVDQQLRTAVAQLIDREEFGQTTMQGTGEIATTLVSSQTQCVTGDADALIPQDAAAAAEALAGTKIRLVAPQIVGTNGAGNTYLQEILRAAGAEVELENVDVGTWISTVLTEPDAWDLTVYADLNFVGSLSSPITNFIGPGILEGGGNIGGAQAPEVERLFAESLTAADEEARCGALNAAADAIIADAHAVPLITDSFIYAQRPGFQVTMLGGSLDDHIFRIVGDGSGE